MLPTINPAVDDVLTIWHSLFCASMSGVNTLTPWITPHRLTPIAHSQSFHVASHGAPSAVTPALLNSKCTWPNVSSVWRASSSTSLRFETSVLTASTVPPASFSSVSALVRSASWMSARTTFMPAPTHRSAIARPMPLAAPVITATLSLNSLIIGLHFHQMSHSCQCAQVDVCDTFDLHVIKCQITFNVNRSFSALKIRLTQIGSVLIQVKP